MIIANPALAGHVLQANMPNSAAAAGIEVKIEDLIDLVGQFRVVRQLPPLIGEEVGREVVDLCPVRFNHWGIKVWAVTWLSKASSFKDIVDLCTEGLIDPKTGEPETDEVRKTHAKDIDSAIASLLSIGFISIERVEQDKLHKGVSDGETAKTLKVIKDRREKSSLDVAVEKAKLLYRLEMLNRVQPQAPKPQIIKHRTAAPAETPGTEAGNDGEA